MPSEFEITPSGSSVPIVQPSADSGLRDRYRRAAVGGLARGVTFAFVTFWLLDMLGLPRFGSDSGILGWPWAFSNAGSVVADILTVALLAGSPALQIAGAVDRRVGRFRLRTPLFLSFAVFGAGAQSNSWAGLALGFAASAALVYAALRRGFAQLAASDPSDLRVAPETSRWAFMNRFEMTSAFVVFALVSVFSVMHPLEQSSGWTDFAGKKSKNVRVNGALMHNASFFYGLKNRGLLRLTITKVTPKDVDPRITYVRFESASGGLDSFDAVPFRMFPAGRHEWTNLFLDFGVRGCPANWRTGATVRSVQLFKKVVVEYVVAGQRHSMTFAGTRSPQSAGFNLCM